MTMKSKLNKESLRIGVPFQSYELEDFTNLYEKGYPSYKKYVERVKKSLYYGTFPSTDRPSKALTELLVDKFCGLCNQDGLDQLNLYEASSISYDACVTPCSVIVALLYLDRLRIHNSDYLSKTSSSQVFIVAMMVASKFLYDDGEEDEVYNDEWATSAAMILTDLNQAEKEFLSAIDWNLYVDIASFITGLSYIETEVAQKEALSRGYFIYSDLVTLCRVLPPVWASFISIIGSALVVCTVGYTLTLTIITAGAFMGRHIENNLTPITTIIDNNNASDVSCCSPNMIESQLEPDLQDSISDLLLDFEDEDEIIEDNKHEHNETKRANRFPALHTLTAALFLASSSTNKVFDSLMKSSYYLLPIQSLVDYSWNNLASKAKLISMNQEPESVLPATSSGNRPLPRKRTRLNLKPLLDKEMTQNTELKLDSYHPAWNEILKFDDVNLRVLPPHPDSMDEYHSFDLQDWITDTEYNETGCFPWSVTNNGQVCFITNETDDLEYYWRALDFLQFSTNFGHIMNVDWLRDVAFII